MGKRTAEPRYNVVSVRVSDNELAMIDTLRGSRRRSAIMLQAFQELAQGREDAAYRERVNISLGGQDRQADCGA